MKKFTILLSLMLLYTALSYAQVAINTDGSNPDSSAILDVKSTTGGLLLPRMTTFQLSYISNPAAGLLVYNTDSSDFYGYNGSKWISLWDTSDTISPWVCGDSITDSRDGQSYNTVQIGTQCWMAENLNIGTMINGSGNQTNNDTIEKYCYNNSSANCDTYGGLYQWDEMMQYTTTPGIQGICPSGWHLPTDDEWKQMEMALGMSQSEADAMGFRGTDEGGKMKETGTTHWYPPNTGATNSSGFTALPGGGRYDDGMWGSLSDIGFWWLSTEYSGTNAWRRFVGYDRIQVDRSITYKTYGFSVRCLKN